MGKKKKENPLSEYRALVFVPEHNMHGKKDVTGAFLPEAEAFLEMCAEGSEIVRFDNSKGFAARRKQVLAALEERKDFDTVAFFCHGWEKGIQAGFSKATTKALAKAILDTCGDNEEVIVPLYCCSTGEDPDDDDITAAGTGDDSFSDRLRDALCADGATQCRVMGHTTVGHTTSNPMVLFMDGMGSEYGGVGGYPPVSPGARKMWSAWKKALRDRKGGNTLRFRFPFMTVGAIHEELGAELVA